MRTGFMAAGVGMLISWASVLAAIFILSNGSLALPWPLTATILFWLPVILATALLVGGYLIPTKAQTSG